MSDVLFRYLLRAHQRDRSAIRRLIFADEPLLEAGVEQLVETAAARVWVTSQHEKVSRRRVIEPASQRDKIRFYDVAEPDRPQPGHFEERCEEFPLRDGLRVYTCPGCAGSGEVPCRRCRSRGRVKCSTCDGHGKSLSGSGRPCNSCQGAGDKLCSRCAGSGRLTCGTCRGEGQLATWEVEVYRWLIEKRSDDRYPMEKPPAPFRRIFNRWLVIAEGDHLASFDDATVAAHLGYDSREARSVAAAAEEARQHLYEKARKSSHRFLFHHTDRSLAPVGYTVVRTRRKARFYWLVGRDERALEMVPMGRLDAVKSLGWLGLGSGGAFAGEGFTEVFDLAVLLGGLPLIDDFSLLGLASGAAVSWLMTLAGVRRVRRHKSPARTLGLLPAGGRPTVLLTCLAYLGSYCGRLRVLDRAYDMQSQRLLGRMRPDRQSESLTIEFPDGRRVRLVEVANPRRLSDAQARLMMRALDGVMILEDTAEEARDLEQRMRVFAAASRRTRIGRLRVDSAGDRDLDDTADGLPLEAIRRAFVEDLRTEIDWQAQLDRLWRPLEELLAPPPAEEAA